MDTLTDKLPYTVRNVQNVPNPRNGDGFMCDLYENGEFIGVVHKACGGSPCHYQGVERQTLKRLQKAASEYMGYELEAEDMVINLLVDEREVQQLAWENRHTTTYAKVQVEPETAWEPDYVYKIIDGGYSLSMERAIKRAYKNKLLKCYKPKAVI